MYSYRFVPHNQFTMRNLSLFFLFALLLVSCADKNVAIDESFYGIIPCADCPGIEYELHLYDDNTFEESILYQDRMVDAHIEDGTYSIENDSIIVIDREGKEGFNRFVLRDDRLVILHLDGKEVEGPLASYYILGKEKPDYSNKLESTMDYSFKASGNEPFWDIRFGNDNKLYIGGLLGGDQISYSFPMPKVKELNEHAKSYRIQNDKLEMNLLISPQACDDTMADYTFTHKVSLQLKLADWDSFQDFEGCGEYDGIYQLNNVWMLHAINGKEISDNNRAAHLQFDISEGVFYGNGGCNNISGSIEHSETTITFSKVAATLMHCENIEDEHKFLSKLEDATYNIQLSRDDLRLSNDENELIFKRLE